jgi:hypothetical protein
MMQRRIKPAGTLAVCLLVAFVIFARGGAPVAAQSGGGYDLTWNSIDGGGGVSTGGGYTLNGSIGQPDAGAQGGGTFTLLGGFWGALDAGRSLFLPLIRR